MRASVDPRSNEAVSASKDSFELDTSLREERRGSSAILEDSVRGWNEGGTSRHGYRRSCSPVHRGRSRSRSRSGSLEDLGKRRRSDASDELVYKHRRYSSSYDCRESFSPIRL